ncbi:class I SAM-dependent methyltransferase [Streptomyces sp. YC504]|uniref:Class I SAM-dependent methyltransferase n=1 Tax=Streptomyces mesophilus TaxID=1775132 RepID=A0A6G4XBQ8_9ACTN|nr:class I SAM-dependent methyltransferase [Streptomyces mesophilus]NGO74081.1 class I SAM-dependent methyltransferase [Streptomyces mesophilus]
MPTLGQLYPQLDSVQLPENLPYTQCSAFELRFLYLLGKHRLTGAQGDLIELGSGGGGSTYAAALGLSENPEFDRSSAKLHAYDFFRVGKGTFATEKFFAGGKAPDGQSSFLEDFQEVLGPFLDFVEIHAGDIWETSDPHEKRPIEFLHVDIAKTARVWTCVAERFLPRLRPGSVLLHQDFAGPRLPWLHYSTGALLPYIEIAGPPIRSTLAFEVTERIPDEVFRAIAEDDFSIEKKIDLISAVQEQIDRDHTDGIPFRSVLELAKAFVLHYEGDHRRAWKIAEPLTDDAYLARTRADHFRQIKAELPAPAPAVRRSTMRRRLGRLARKAGLR